MLVILEKKFSDPRHEEALPIGLALGEFRPQEAPLARARAHVERIGDKERGKAKDLQITSTSTDALRTLWTTVFKRSSSLVFILAGPLSSSRS